MADPGPSLSAPTNLRASGDERIPVAAPRSSPPQGAPRARVVDATGAGLTLIAVVGMVAAVGTWGGGQLGVAVSGGIIGVILGLPVAFAAIYKRYKDL